MARRSELDVIAEFIIDVMRQVAFGGLCMFILYFTDKKCVECVQYYKLICFFTGWNILLLFDHGRLADKNWYFACIALYNISFIGCCVLGIKVFSVFFF